MVIGTFAGWPGPPAAAGAGSQVGRPPATRAAAPAPDRGLEGLEVVYGMRPAWKDTIVVTVVSNEVCMRKTVRASGHARVEFERGLEAIALCTDDGSLTVTGSHRTRRSDLRSLDERSLMDLRAFLAPSSAVRAFRSLATAVDETESDTAERMSVRLAGALLSQFDGDPGAVRRLSRELHGRYAGQRAQPRRCAADDWFAYKRSVVRACAELHMALAGLTCWDLRRHSRALTWLIEVEAAWFAYVASSMAWRARC